MRKLQSFVFGSESLKPSQMQTRVDMSKMYQEKLELSQRIASSPGYANLSDPEKGKIINLVLANGVSLPDVISIFGNEDKRRHLSEYGYGASPKKLYILSSTFDEGSERGIAHSLFWADSRLDVAKYILAQVQDYIKNKTPSAFGIYSVVIRMSFDDRDFLMYKIDDFLLITSPEEFLRAIDMSALDGDPYALVSISEYNSNEIINL